MERRVGTLPPCGCVRSAQRTSPSWVGPRRGNERRRANLRVAAEHGAGAERLGRRFRFTGRTLSTAGASIFRAPSLGAHGARPRRRAGDRVRSLGRAVGRRAPDREGPPRRRGARSRREAAPRGCRTRRIDLGRVDRHCALATSLQGCRDIFRQPVFSPDGSRPDHAPARVGTARVWENRESGERLQIGFEASSDEGPSGSLGIAAVAFGDDAPADPHGLAPTEVSRSSRCGSRCRGRLRSGTSRRCGGRLRWRGAGRSRSGAGPTPRPA